MLTVAFSLLRMAFYSTLALIVAWVSSAVVPTVHAEEAPNAGLPQQDRQHVESIQPLLLAAIRQGEAHGVLVGPAADAIAGQFASREPINVDVTAGAALVLPGCKQMTVDTHQQQVADREKSTVRGEPGRQLPPKDMRLKYRINFCNDGTVPPHGTRLAAATAGPSTAQAASQEAR